MSEPNRTPAGVPTGGQFATAGRNESAVRLVAIPSHDVTVQGAPAIVDDALLGGLDSEGRLTSTVEVPLVDWERCITEDAQADLLSSAQVEGSEPCQMDHRIVAATDDHVYIQVTNNLSQWARDDDAVDNYNACVEPGEALTPDKIAWLRANGSVTPNGQRAALDLDGYPTAWTEWGPVRVTNCCGASAKGLEDYVGCRKCCAEVDPSIGMEPRLVEQYSGTGISWNTLSEAQRGDDFEDRVENNVAYALVDIQRQATQTKPRLWESRVVTLDAVGSTRVRRDSDWAPGTTTVGADEQVVARVAYTGRVASRFFGQMSTGLAQRLDGKFQFSPGAERKPNLQCSRNTACSLLDRHPDNCEEQS